MKFRRSEQPGELTINITPLIDVVFLLLIFFMVTTSFSRESWMEVNLPQANAQAPAPPTARIDVVVDRDGNYLVNGQPLQNNRVQTLINALEQETGGNRDLLVVLTADADARHQAVVSAMEGIGRSGFERLQIATREILPD